MEKTIVLEEYIKVHSRRKNLLRQYGTTFLFLGPFIIAFCLFFLYPLFYGIYISLTNFKYGSPGGETFNSFHWYKILFAPSTRAENLLFESFWRSFLHSFIFSIIMVPIAILLPLGLAILVNMKPPGYKLFRALIYMPSIVPLTAAGSIFVLLFNPPAAHGLLYELFGVDTQWFIESMLKFKIGSFQVDVAYAWIPIFLMCLWGGWGGNFIILSAGLQNVPKSLYEACSIDSSSRWKKITNVTIPNIKGQLVLTLFTTIIGYLGLYGQNYVLGGPINTKISSLPGGSKVSTIIFFIQDIVANNPNFKTKFYGLGAAASIVFVIFTAIISGIQMYCTRERKTGTKISEAYAKWYKAKQK